MLLVDFNCVRMLLFLNEKLNLFITNSFKTDHTFIFILKVDKVEGFRLAFNVSRGR